jgi:phosphoglycerate kinase
MSKTILKLAKVQDSSIKGRNIVMRVDYNVPIDNGIIVDDTRIKASLKTLKYLLDLKCKVTLISHLGRPKGNEPKYSLKPVASHLQELIGAKVYFAPDCIGENTKRIVEEAVPGEIVLLENLRFHSEEKKNDADFAKQLSEYGDFFIQEAFGTLHRAHASTAGISKYLDNAIGFLVQKELEYLDKSMINPARPFVAIIGGAKVSDKIDVLYSLIDKADTIIIGGAMAYTFLAAQYSNVGKSLVEKEKIEDAKKIILKAFKNDVELLLPADHTVVKEIKFDAPKEVTQSMAIGDNWIGVDIGPRSEMLFIEKIKGAKTVFWNGPLGIFETDAFAHGSIAIAKAMVAATKKGAATILGGGDTLGVIKKANISPDQLSHCSTGGGASLEFIEGKKLPGLVALSQS